MRQASKASPRWAHDAATTTARSPIRQVADAVHGRDGLDRVLLRDCLRDAAQFGLGRRVRDIGQPGDRMAVVMVAHGSGEDRDPARLGRHHGGLNLIHRQWGIAQRDQA